MTNLTGRTFELMSESPLVLHYFDSVAQLSNALNEHVDAYENVFLLTDSHVAQYCIPLLLGACPGLQEAEILELDPGETAKNLDICNHIWSHLLERGASRSSLLINVGGGVITDLGGFIASTYKRGIPFIHVPTSLMAMTDAAIGGKTGIDHQLLKNCIGTFAWPSDILITPDFLSTLPEEEMLSGFAEMLKHALIADAGFWHDLTAIDEINSQAVTPFLLQSIDVKVKICSEDPMEKGPRKLLNFGHTIGHAIESWFLAKGDPVSHGFAVSLGMMAETQMSSSSGTLPKDSADHIIRKLQHFYHYDVHTLPRFDEFSAYLRNDKKNKNADSINFTLLREIGEGTTDVVVSPEKIRDAWEALFNG